jgi:hypothetical protein
VKYGNGEGTNTSVTSNRKSRSKTGDLIPECCSPLCERAASILSAANAHFYTK